MLSNENVEKVVKAPRNPTMSPYKKQGRRAAIVLSAGALALSTLGWSAVVVSVLALGASGYAWYQTAVNARLFNVGPGFIDITRDSITLNR